MSKSKLDRRFNKRGRLQPVETKIDESEQKRLTQAYIESEGGKDGNDYSLGYDAANALILPAKKRKVKHKYDVSTNNNKLSKKEKKRLEKIVEVKDKKLNRQKIFESLALHRASEKAEAQFVSIANPDGGSGGGGKSDSGEGFIPAEPVAGRGASMKINSIAGSNKKTKERVSSSSETSSDEDDDDNDDEDDDDKDEAVGNESHAENATKTAEEDRTSSTEASTAESTGDDAQQSTNATQDVRDSATSTTASQDSAHAAPGIPDSTPKAIIVREPAKFVVIERDEEIAKARLKLPILEEEQKIVETINDNDVTIVSGETGSGKTTQVPQFLYEAGYCETGMIGVTEPRRVAAIAMATRVAREMNLQDTKEIAYQIRYEKTADSSTKIKFMTDGVLLKEIQSDFLLTKYRVVIIDEAHERSVYSDILIGLLSRIVPLRRKRGFPLKLIVMSATLRVEDFTANARLFRTPPPCIHVEARQFPVTVHFNKKTPDDFVQEAFKKASKIHRTLPEGGILIFVTGRQEVHRLCAELRKAFPTRRLEGGKQPEGKAGKRARRKSKSISEPEKVKATNINLDDYLIIPEDEESALIGDGDSRGNVKEVAGIVDASNEDEEDDGDEEEDLVMGDGDASMKNAAAPEPPMHVLPLYSLLSPERQRLVFAPPPEGHRLCVVATNVAETSLTIPGVRYVVDCGKVKMRVFDRVTGVSAFAVLWASQASANQRAGRAGRTAPGHCYRLYSSAVFNDEFPKFAPPEMTMRPVDDLFLHMKDLGIDKVINFPFPTPPSTEALKVAEKLLLSLGALKEDERLSQLSITARKKVDEEKFPPKLTPLGRLMALFPISPRYSKMLALGHQHGCLPYVIAIISALTVQEVLFQDAGRGEEMEQLATSSSSSSKPLQALRQKWAGVGNCRKLGDLMVLLKAVGAAEFEGCSEGFCRQFGLRHKAMLEIRKLRSQLTKTVNTLIMDEALHLSPKMDLPTDVQAKLLCQIVLSGCGDRVARKMANQKVDGESKPLKNAYEGTTIEDPLFIHPSSVLFRDLPDYVVFQESVETTKMYMKGVIAIEPHWLPVFAEQHCRFEDPLDEPAPTYNDEKGLVYCHQASTFGPRGWPLPAISRPHPAGESRFRWFARFFLEGRVCPAVERFVPVLLSNPTVMNKSWANLQPRTNSILRALAAGDAYSKDKLKAAFEKDVAFLKNEYLQWIPEALHAQVEAIWPPLDGM